MTSMSRQYVRALLVWGLTLTALYIFQSTFGRS
jgi:hypothetical protein